jgi:hypothetical protein
MLTSTPSARPAAARSDWAWGGPSGGHFKFEVQDVHRIRFADQPSLQAEAVDLMASQDLRDVRDQARPVGGIHRGRPALAGELSGRDVVGHSPDAQLQVEPVGHWGSALPPGHQR